MCLEPFESMDTNAFLLPNGNETEDLALIIKQNEYCILSVNCCTVSSYVNVALFALTKYELYLKEGH